VLGLPSATETALATGAGGASVAKTGPAAKAAPMAKAARTVFIVETGRLHLTKEGESTLNERGTATGTFGGALLARLTLSANRVNATFTIYSKGGSITGRASARFVSKGSIVYYGGTLAIVRGTGAYRHASGPKIGISGTINHLTFALTVKARGWMSF
jgi:hypothetical protein